MRRLSIHGTIRQICSFEVCVDQSRPAEDRPAEVGRAEVRPAEVRLHEVRPAEVRPAEVRPAEVRQNLRVLFSPLTPRLDSFLKLCEMFGIRQGSPPRVRGCG
jgi:hypothetical protein